MFPLIKMVMTVIKTIKTYDIMYFRGSKTNYIFKEGTIYQNDIQTQKSKINCQCYYKHTEHETPLSIPFKLIHSVFKSYKYDVCQAFESHKILKFHLACKTMIETSCLHIHDFLHIRTKFM